jgi:hypothetical protein
LDVENLFVDILDVGKMDVDKRTYYRGKRVHFHGKSNWPSYECPKILSCREMDLSKGNAG